MMDSKMHRYMQRIDKLMSQAKNMNVSPIRSRPSKSPLSLTTSTNNLDQYLKYDLTVKIISRVVERYHKNLVSYFLNELRHGEHRHKELVYRFVAIEKEESPLKKYQSVDTSISIKILKEFLKQMIKKRKVEGFKALKSIASKNQHNIQISAKIDKIEVKSARSFVNSDSSKKIEKNDKLETFNFNKQQQQKLALHKSYFGKSLIVLISRIKKKNLISSFQGILLHVHMKLQKLQKQIKNLPKEAESTNEGFTFIKQPIINSKASTETIQNIYQLEAIISKIQRRKLAGTIKIIQNRQISKFNSLKQNLNFAVYLKLFIKRKEQTNLQKGFHQIDLMKKSSPIPSENHEIQQNYSASKMKSSGRSSQLSQGKFKLYELMENMSKVVYIASKMYIPLRNAFKKIDKFASFSYKIESRMKILPQNYLRDALNSIKKYSQSSLMFKSKGFKLGQILQSKLRRSIVFAFTKIKIIEKPKKVENKYNSIHSVSTEIHSFIEQRNQNHNIWIRDWQKLKELIKKPFEPVAEVGITG